ncbi:MAG: WXG100 family type VII secretion target [Erysipelotrichaceae bacterium]|nr:WXG100 family type VII secretion target [Erysipelotrichaceae bacterium]
MNRLFVSSEELAGQASGLTSMSLQLQELFNSIGQDIHQLSGSWNSPAQKSLQTRFESLIPVFRQYCAKLDSYAGYLQSTASAYAENEQMLSNAAGA